MSYFILLIVFRLSVGCNPLNLQVIELGFFPEPVETFQAPHFGVATLGHSSPAKRLMLRWRSFLNRLQWLRVAANHCFMICLRAVRHRHSCQQFDQVWQLMSTSNQSCSG